VWHCDCPARWHSIVSIWKDSWFVFWAQKNCIFTTAQISVYNCTLKNPVSPRPGRGRGIVFGRFLSFFLSLFLCHQHYEKTARQICMKFSGKVWSDHGTTWLHFGSIRVNGSAVKGQFVIKDHSSEETSQLHSLGGSRGRGLLCLAPQLVYYENRTIVHTKTSKNWVKNKATIYPTDSDGQLNFF